MIKANFKFRTYQLLFVFFSLFFIFGIGLSVKSDQLNLYNVKITVGVNDGQYEITNSNQISQSDSYKNDFYIVAADNQKLLITFSLLQTFDNQNSDNLLKGISVRLRKIIDQDTISAYYKIIRRVNNNVIQYKIFDGTGDTQIAYTNTETPASLTSDDFHLINKHSGLDNFAATAVASDWVAASDGGFLVALASMLAGETSGSSNVSLAAAGDITVDDAKELFALIELWFAELDIAEWLTDMGTELIDYNSAVHEWGYGFKLNSAGVANSASSWFQLIYKYSNVGPTYKVFIANENNFAATKISSPDSVSSFSIVTTDEATTRTAMLNLFISTLGGDVTIATKQHARVLYESLTSVFNAMQAILTDTTWIQDPAETETVARQTNIDKSLTFIKEFTDTNTIDALNNRGTQVEVKLKLIISDDHLGKISVSFTNLGETIYIAGKKMHEKWINTFEDFVNMNSINQRIKLKLIQEAIMAQGWFKLPNVLKFKKKIAELNFKLDISKIGRFKISLNKNFLNATAISFTTMDAINEIISLKILELTRSRLLKSTAIDGGWTKDGDDGTQEIYSKVITDGASSPSTMNLQLKLETSGINKGKITDVIQTNSLFGFPNVALVDDTTFVYIPLSKAFFTRGDWTDKITAFKIWINTVRLLNDGWTTVNNEVGIYTKNKFSEFFKPPSVFVKFEPTRTPDGDPDQNIFTSENFKIYVFNFESDHSDDSVKTFIPHGHGSSSVDVHSEYVIANDLTTKKITTWFVIQAFNADADPDIDDEDEDIYDGEIDDTVHWIKGIENSNYITYTRPLNGLNFMVKINTELLATNIDRTSYGDIVLMEVQTDALGVTNSQEIGNILFSVLSSSTSNPINLAEQFFINYVPIKLMIEKLTNGPNAWSLVNGVSGENTYYWKEFVDPTGTNVKFFIRIKANGLVVIDPDKFELYTTVNNVYNGAKTSANSDINSNPTKLFLITSSFAAKAELNTNALLISADFTIAQIETIINMYLNDLYLTASNQGGWTYSAVTVAGPNTASNIKYTKEIDSAQYTLLLESSGADANNFKVEVDSTKSILNDGALVTDGVENADAIVTAHLIRQIIIALEAAGWLRTNPDVNPHDFQQTKDGIKFFLKLFHEGADAKKYELFTTSDGRVDGPKSSLSATGTASDSVVKIIYAHYDAAASIEAIDTALNSITGWLIDPNTTISDSSNTYTKDITGIAYTLTIKQNGNLPDSVTIIANYNGADYVVVAPDTVWINYDVSVTAAINTWINTWITQFTNALSTWTLTSNSDFNIYVSPATADFYGNEFTLKLMKTGSNILTYSLYSTASESDILIAADVTYWTNVATIMLAIDNWNNEKIAELDAALTNDYSWIVTSPNPINNPSTNTYSKFVKDIEFKLVLTTAGVNSQKYKLTTTTHNIATDVYLLLVTNDGNPDDNSDTETFYTSLATIDAAIDAWIAAKIADIRIKVTAAPATTGAGNTSWVLKKGSTYTKLENYHKFTLTFFFQSTATRFDLFDDSSTPYYLFDWSSTYSTSSTESTPIEDVNTRVTAYTNLLELKLKNEKTTVLTAARWTAATEVAASDGAPAHILFTKSYSGDGVNYDFKLKLTSSGIDIGKFTIYYDATTDVYLDPGGGYQDSIPTDDHVLSDALTINTLVTNWITAYVATEILMTKLTTFGDGWEVVPGTSDSLNKIYLKIISYRTSYHWFPTNVYDEKFSNPSSNNVFFIAIEKTGVNAGKFELYSTINGRHDGAKFNAQDFRATNLFLIDELTGAKDLIETDDELLAGADYTAAKIAIIINMYLNDLYLTSNGWAMSSTDSTHLIYTKMVRGHTFTLMLESSGNNVNKYVIKIGTPLTTIHSGFNDDYNTVETLIITWLEAEMLLIVTDLITAWGAPVNTTPHLYTFTQTIAGTSFYLELNRTGVNTEKFVLYSETAAGDKIYYTITGAETVSNVATLINYDDVTTAATITAIKKALIIGINAKITTETSLSSGDHWAVQSSGNLVGVTDPYVYTKTFGVGDAAYTLTLNFKITGDDLGKIRMFYALPDGTFDYIIGSDSDDVWVVFVDKTTLNNAATAFQMVMEKIKNVTRQLATGNWNLISGSTNIYERIFLTETVYLDLRLSTTAGERGGEFQLYTLSGDDHTATNNKTLISTTALLAHLTPDDVVKMINFFLAVKQLTAADDWSKKNDIFNHEIYTKNISGKTFTIKLGTSTASSSAYSKIAISFDYNGTKTYISSSSTDSNDVVYHSYTTIAAAELLIANWISTRIIEINDYLVHTSNAGGGWVKQQNSYSYTKTVDDIIFTLTFRSNNTTDKLIYFYLSAASGDSIEYPFDGTSYASNAEYATDKSFIDTEISEYLAAKLVLIATEITTETSPGSSDDHWLMQTIGNAISYTNQLGYTKTFGRYTLTLNLQTAGANARKIRLSYIDGSSIDYIIGSATTWVDFVDKNQFNTAAETWKVIMEKIKAVTDQLISANGWSQVDGQIGIYSKDFLTETVYLDLELSTATGDNGGEFQLYSLAPTGSHGNDDDVTFIPNSVFQTPFETTTVTKKFNAFLTAKQLDSDPDWIAGPHTASTRIYTQDFSDLEFTIRLGINPDVSSTYTKIAISSIRSGTQTWINSAAETAINATQLPYATISAAETLITNWITAEITKFTTALNSANGWTLTETEPTSSTTGFNTYTSDATNATFHGNSFAVKLLTTGETLGSYEFYSVHDTSTKLIASGTYWTDLSAITNAINAWNTAAIAVIKLALTTESSIGGDAFTTSSSGTDRHIFTRTKNGHEFTISLVTTGRTAEKITLITDLSPITYLLESNFGLYVTFTSLADINTAIDTFLAAEITAIVSSLELISWTDVTGIDTNPYVFSQEKAGYIFYLELITAGANTEKYKLYTVDSFGVKTYYDINGISTEATPTLIKYNDSNNTAAKTLTAINNAALIAIESILVTSNAWIADSGNLDHQTLNTYTKVIDDISYTLTVKKNTAEATKIKFYTTYNSVESVIRAEDTVWADYSTTITNSIEIWIIRRISEISGALFLTWKSTTNINDNVYVSSATADFYGNSFTLKLLTTGAHVLTYSLFSSDDATDILIAIEDHTYWTGIDGIMTAIARWNNDKIIAINANLVGSDQGQYGWTAVIPDHNVDPSSTSKTYTKVVQGITFDLALMTIGVNSLKFKLAVTAFGSANPAHPFDTENGYSRNEFQSDFNAISGAISDWIDAKMITIQSEITAADVVVGDRENTAWTISSTNGHQVYTKMEDDHTFTLTLITTGADAGKFSLRDDSDAPVYLLSSSPSSFIKYVNMDMINFAVTTQVKVLAIVSSLEDVSWVKTGAVDPYVFTQTIAQINFGLELISSGDDVEKFKLYIIDAAGGKTYLTYLNVATSPAAATLISYADYDAASTILSINSYAIDRINIALTSSGDDAWAVLVASNSINAYTKTIDGLEYTLTVQKTGINAAKIKLVTTYVATEYDVIVPHTAWAGLATLTSKINDWTALRITEINTYLVDSATNDGGWIEDTDTSNLYTKTVDDVIFTLTLQAATGTDNLLKFSLSTVYTGGAEYPFDGTSYVSNAEYVTDKTTIASEIAEYLASKIEIINAVITTETQGSDDQWTPQPGGNTIGFSDPYIYTKVFGAYLLTLELKIHDVDNARKIRLSYTDRLSTDYIIGAADTWVAFVDKATLNTAATTFQTVMEKIKVVTDQLLVAGWDSTTDETGVYELTILDTKVYLDLEFSTAVGANGGEFQLYILSAFGNHAVAADKTFIPDAAFQTPFGSAAVVKKINVFLIAKQLSANTDWAVTTPVDSHNIYTSFFFGKTFKIKLSTDSAAASYTKIAISFDAAGTESYINSSSTDSDIAAYQTYTTIAAVETLITTWITAKIAEFTNGLTYENGWTSATTNKDFNTYTTAAANVIFHEKSFAVKLMKTGANLGSYELYGVADAATKLINAGTYWTSLSTITNAIDAWNTAAITAIKNALETESYTGNDAFSRSSPSPTNLLFYTRIKNGHTFTISLKISGVNARKIIITTDDSAIKGYLLASGSDTFIDFTNLATINAAIDIWLENRISAIESILTGSDSGYSWTRDFAAGVTNPSTKIYTKAVQEITFKLALTTEGVNAEKFKLAVTFADSTFYPFDTTGTVFTDKYVNNNFQTNLSLIENTINDWINAKTTKITNALSDWTTDRTRSSVYTIYTSPTTAIFYGYEFKIKVIKTGSNILTYSLYSASDPSDILITAGTYWINFATITNAISLWNADKIRALNEVLTGDSADQYSWMIGSGGTTNPASKTYTKIVRGITFNLVLMTAGVNSQKYKLAATFGGKTFDPFANAAAGYATESFYDSSSLAALDADIIVWINAKMITIQFEINSIVGICGTGIWETTSSGSPYIYTMKQCSHVFELILHTTGVNSGKFSLRVNSTPPVNLISSGACTLVEYTDLSSINIAINTWFVNRIIAINNTLKLTHGWTAANANSVHSLINTYTKKINGIIYKISLKQIGDQAESIKMTARYNKSDDIIVPQNTKWVDYNTSVTAAIDKWLAAKLAIITTPLTSSASEWTLSNSLLANAYEKTYSGKKFFINIIASGANFGKYKIYVTSDDVYTGTATDLIIANSWRTNGPEYTSRWIDMETTDDIIAAYLVATIDAQLLGDDTSDLSAGEWTAGTDMDTYKVYTFTIPDPIQSNSGTVSGDDFESEEVAGDELTLHLELSTGMIKLFKAPAADSSNAATEYLIGSASGYADYYDVNVNVRLAFDLWTDSVIREINTKLNDVTEGDEATAWSATDISGDVFVYKITKNNHVFTLKLDTSDDKKGEITLITDGDSPSYLIGGSDGANPVEFTDINELSSVMNEWLVRQISLVSTKLMTDAHGWTLIEIDTTSDPTTKTYTKIVQGITFNLVLTTSGRDIEKFKLAVTFGGVTVYPFNVAGNYLTDEFQTDLSAINTTITNWITAKLKAIKLEIFNNDWRIIDSYSNADLHHYRQLKTNNIFTLKLHTSGVNIGKFSLSYSPLIASSLPSTHLLGTGVNTLIEYQDIAAITSAVAAANDDVVSGFVQILTFGVDPWTSTTSDADTLIGIKTFTKIVSGTEFTLVIYTSGDHDEKFQIYTSNIGDASVNYYVIGDASTYQIIIDDDTTYSQTAASISENLIQAWINIQKLPSTIVGISLALSEVGWTPTKTVNGGSLHAFTKFYRGNILMTKYNSDDNTFRILENKKTALRSLPTTHWKLLTSTVSDSTYTSFESINILLASYNIDADIASLIAPDGGWTLTGNADGIKTLIKNYNDGNDSIAKTFTLKFYFAGENSGKIWITTSSIDSEQSDITVLGSELKPVEFIEPALLDQKLKLFLITTALALETSNWTLMADEGTLNVYTQTVADWFFTLILETDTTASDFKKMTLYVDVDGIKTKLSSEPFAFVTNAETNQQITTWLDEKSSIVAKELEEQSRSLILMIFGIVIGVVILLPLLIMVITYTPAHRKPSTSKRLS